MVKTHDLKEGAGRTYWNEAKARGIIDAWQQSGETLAAFARRLGVNHERLRRWASRLRARVEGDAVPSGAGACRRERAGGGCD